MQLKTILQDHCKSEKQGFSLCLDIWTSKSQHAFLGITIHWINKAWTIQTKVLRLIDLRRRHTGKYIYRSLQNLLEELQIEKNIVSISHDNAGNNSTFIDRFIDKQERTLFTLWRGNIRCLAHILNLVVQDILTTIKMNLTDIELQAIIEDADILENTSNLSTQPAIGLECFNPILRMRKIVLRLRLRQHLIYALNAQIAAFNLKGRRPIIDFPVRWSSTYRMIKSYLRMQQAIDIVISQHPTDFENLALSENDILLLTSLSEVLAELDLLTIKIQSECYDRNISKAEQRHIPTIGIYGTPGICYTESHASARIEKIPVSASTARLSTQCTYTTMPPGLSPDPFPLSRV